MAQATSTNSPTMENITSDMSTAAATSTKVSNTATNNFTTVTMQTDPDINTANTTNPPGGSICNNSSCGDSAECIQLHDNYICRCPLTQSYNGTSRSCEVGYGVFGELTLPGRNFSETTSSTGYTDVYNEVMDWFQGILEVEYKENYTTTVIESLSAVTSRRRLRSSAADVKALVTCLFRNVPDDEVNRFIQRKAAESGFGYESRSICDFACDPVSTSCRASTNGQSSDCVCLEGHFKAESHRIDTCSSCSAECKAEDHRGCVWNADTKVTDCQCLAGYKVATNGGRGCKACDFGYSGQDCKDNFLLILVIVGSVAGGVIIALIGAVIGITVRSSRKKKDNERTELLPTDRNSGSPSPVAGNLFPKVQVKTDQGHVNTASNLYEDEQYSRTLPQRDYDEDGWYEMSKSERRY